MIAGGWLIHTPLPLSPQQDRPPVVHYGIWLNKPSFTGLFPFPASFPHFSMSVSWNHFPNNHVHSDPFLNFFWRQTDFSGLPLWPLWPGCLGPEEEKQKDDLDFQWLWNWFAGWNRAKHCHSLRLYPLLVRGDIGSGVAKALPEVFVLRFQLPDTFISPCVCDFQEFI